MIIAFCYHQRHSQDKVTQINKLAIVAHAIKQNASMDYIKQLIKFYANESLSDELNFGTVRQKAFDILDKQAIIQVHCRKLIQCRLIFLLEKCGSSRCLMQTLEFSSTDGQLLESINWLKNLKSKKIREALYEIDKLVRSNQILQYLLDPNIISTTHCSQNRLESYHQLRSEIAQAQ